MDAGRYPRSKGTRITAVRHLLMVVFGKMVRGKEVSMEKSALVYIILTAVTVAFGFLVKIVTIRQNICPADAPFVGIPPGI